MGLEHEIEAPAGEYSRNEDHSARRINRIAQYMSAQRYLEIGVSRGRTFNRVSMDVKVGVDPHFRFELARYEREGVEFHSVPSDEYFTKAEGPKEFDIIFLDGLHTFQQAFRDFCNSLVCSHDRTVWLIDDVTPCDVFSAWPNRREAMDFRKRGGGGTSTEWHGDVYKLIFALHDFFPTLTFVTLIGSGNPQTIVWRAPRTGFCPAFNSLESIERLGYFDMLKREKILNLREEEEGFHLFFDSMPRQSRRLGATASNIVG